MSVVIAGVEPGSPAGRRGIGAGHVLHRINGHPINDVLDYRFYMMERSLALDLSDNGRDYSVTLRKGEYDDLGLAFASYLMDEQRSCKNKCCFCFIDQLPPGLRETLYFKDDDSRLGFLFGNYMTLTNLEDGDIRRIIDMRISPVNISVHTTNPALRVEMMKNPRAGAVLDYLPRLAEAGIKINAQLVLCPGVNDGPELERSLMSLAALGEALQSCSAVPVGLTKFREGLPHLRLFTPEEARAVLSVVEAHAANRLEQAGSRTFYASDEFYLKAGLPLPGNEAYEDYYQLENGVGMTTLLRHEFGLALDDEGGEALDRRVTLATGVAAAPLLRELGKLAMAKFPGLVIETVPVVNAFFGETITVAGLVTGGDLIRALSGRDLGDEVLFPVSMLRHEGDLFLDGVSLEELEAALGRPVRPVEVDGFGLLDAMLGR